MSDSSKEKWCSSMRRCPNASYVKEKDAWLCNVDGYCVYQLPNTKKDDYE